MSPVGSVMAEEPAGAFVVDESSPSGTGSVEYGPDQADAGLFAGKPPDDFGASAGSPEGAFQQIEGITGVTGEYRDVAEAPQSVPEARPDSYFVVYDKNLQDRFP